MKKKLSLVLIALLTFNLVACSTTPSATNNVENTTPAEISTSDETSLSAQSSLAVEASTSDNSCTSTEASDLEETSEASNTDDKSISRIAASGPLAQIMLYAIAPEMFVGLASEWDDNDTGIIPKDFLDLPYLGQLYSSADLNIEQLALANPQLIIDIGEKKPSSDEDMLNLQKQTNIPCTFVEATLSTMPQAYRELGSILGKESEGEELASFLEKTYNRTMSIMEKVGDNKVKVLYISGEEGLNVLGKGSYHAELLDILTDNIAVFDNPSSKGLGNLVDMEQIALMNPDFMIFAPESIYDSVSDNTSWANLKAIQNKNYVEVPSGPHNWMGTPPSVQRYLGMIWLTYVLYPEYCDYDVKEEILEYYRLFYHCELTDEQYNELTKNAFINN